MESWPKTKLGGGKRGGKRTKLPTAAERGFASSDKVTCRKRKNRITYCQVDGHPKTVRAMRDLKNTTVQLECPHCPYTNNKGNRGAFQQHYLKHYAGKFPCGDCGDTFHLSTEFRSHFLWKCQDCGKGFKNGRLGRLRHIKKMHKKFTPTHRIKRKKRKSKESGACQGGEKIMTRLEKVALIERI